MPKKREKKQTPEAFIAGVIDRLEEKFFFHRESLVELVKLAAKAKPRPPQKVIDHLINAGASVEAAIDYLKRAAEAL